MNCGDIVNIIDSQFNSKNHNIKIHDFSTLYIAILPGLGILMSGKSLSNIL